MEGIGAIRDALEENNFTKVGHRHTVQNMHLVSMGHSEDALDSAPGFGDKKTYK
jgi:porphobilinogen synthase